MRDDESQVSMEVGVMDRLGVKPGLWSSDQVAAFLGVPLQTLYVWRHRGVGPRAFKVGRHLRFDPAEVRYWLESQRSVLRQPAE